MPLGSVNICMSDRSLISWKRAKSRRGSLQQQQHTQKNLIQILIKHTTTRTVCCYDKYALSPREIRNLKLPLHTNVYCKPPLLKEPNLNRETCTRDRFIPLCILLFLLEFFWGVKLVFVLPVRLWGILFGFSGFRARKWGQVSVWLA